MVPIMLSQPLHALRSLPEDGHGRTRCSDQKTPTPSTCNRPSEHGMKTSVGHQPVPKFQPPPMCQPRELLQPRISERDIQSHNLLRRKTPNGTLAAGYDGSSLEQTSRYPAEKHTLVPVSKFTSNPFYPFQAQEDLNFSGGPKSNSQLTPIRRDCGFGRVADAQGPSHASHLSAMQTGVTTTMHICTTVVCQVPTVLQPLWPPYVGPTALQPPGPVGPYWPDGAFEPYRPATFRGHAADLALNHTQVPHDRSIYNDTKLASSSELAGIGCNQNWLETPHALVAAESLASERRVLHPTSRCLPHDFQARLAIGARIPSSPKTPVPNMLPPKILHDVPQDSQSFADLSEPMHFKEKTLQWAHKIYCNLLAFVEQSRRSTFGSDHPEAKLLPHWRNRRPYPSWSHQHSTSAPPSTCSRTHQTSQRGIAASLTSSQMHSRTKLPARQNQDIREVGSKLSANIGLNPVGKQSMRSHSLRQNVHRMHYNAQDNIDDSPFTLAIKAMEVLGRLCQESQWQWLDGMLLNGCLAYGLGYHSKATKWYLRVLHQDSTNVEALSNLAATLLALGRKTEAENYWVQAIKQKPGYFEAVEHLVGLLHDEGRSRDAVNVIEHVQVQLRITNQRSSLVTALPLSEHDEYAISPCENGRLLALIHGKGNVLYQIGENEAAAQAFSEAILLGTGQHPEGISGLIRQILRVFTARRQDPTRLPPRLSLIEPLILLPPEAALETSSLVFPPCGRLPGLSSIPKGAPQKAAIAIISNSLLSLAKIYQDSITCTGSTAMNCRSEAGVQGILALYYLSLSLQPSPSTANNVGILLAGIQQPARSRKYDIHRTVQDSSSMLGVQPDSGVALALAYYDYGLKLDAKHAHLYTNLGSLFKDLGHLSSAISMYEKAVECDGSFDIALANLANAVKDRGNIKDAIEYYKRAVIANPDFAEAVCGLANALNSVCSWQGRGGVYRPSSGLDRWHVDGQGLLRDSRVSAVTSSGWMQQVVQIVQKQLREGEGWGKAATKANGFGDLVSMSLRLSLPSENEDLRRALYAWSAEPWEGAKIVRLVERLTKVLTWRAYEQQYLHNQAGDIGGLDRPQLPQVLAVPSAPTVLPFHTFTCPLTAKEIRLISQRNSLRVSCAALKASWLPSTIFKPPPPPDPSLNVGYVSSDFNNHPLAHLMQSVFGMHNRSRVRAYCYATTASDGSIHRTQIEREAPCFRDCFTWSVERLVNQIVADDIHILVNLNGYTRGAKNEVFAARPAPIQMSFMGFAGTLGAEWCDYLLADELAIPRNMLRPYRSNVGILDQIRDGNDAVDAPEWIYGENIIYTKETFFCCDHKQSAPDAHERRRSWSEEGFRRRAMRKEMFPDLPDDFVILGNFNQLYKVDPTTFRTWLRILSRVPKAILWLLRFPELGEQHLKETAEKWVGLEVASRLRFTDVAPKHHHIARASVCDLFLDTPECNAHTTAADVLWSGTPLLTYPKHEYKMCSRMAASILRGALPRTPEGDRAMRELVAHDDESYEEQAVELAYDLMVNDTLGVESARLLQIRKLLFESRWTSALFDTQRWVHELEDAYEESWRRWVKRIGGDIWLQ